VRLDSGVYPGWTVPLDYDPLLAKLVVWDEDRHSAIQRMRRALDEYSITGVESNISFFREILDDAAFRKGWLHTGFVADYFARRKQKPDASPELELAMALAAAAAHSKNGKPETSNQRPETSRWLTDGRGTLLR
jgi:acetyl-CoA carboxylase biotin carboxylase subunit